MRKGHPYSEALKVIEKIGYFTLLINLLREAVMRLSIAAVSFSRMSLELTHDLHITVTIQQWEIEQYSHCVFRNRS